jgi:uncharacterized protein with ParB-like and HNH nuclease domain
MNLIDKIRNENIKLTKGLRCHTQNMEDYLVSFRHDVSIDFDVFLPSINKNLQRGNVWTLQQKQELIRSIILGRNINLPTVIIQVDANSKRTIEVIDGKQRISAIIDFLDGKFEVDGNFYNDFNLNLPKYPNANCFKTNLSIKMNVYYSYPEDLITDQQKIELFKMLNFSGTPQDEEHLKFLS